MDRISKVSTTTLSAPLKDVNTLENPTKIVPEKKEIDANKLAGYDIPGYSYTILTLSE